MDGGSGRESRWMVLMYCGGVRRRRELLPEFLFFFRLFKGGRESYCRAGWEGGWIGYDDGVMWYGPREVIMQ